MPLTQQIDVPARRTILTENVAVCEHNVALAVDEVGAGFGDREIE